MSGGLTIDGVRIPREGQKGVYPVVEARRAWASEARDFTPWLARNLWRFRHAVHMPFLKLVSVETNVGPFRADILATNAESGEYVLIENQLGCSDHVHLGQLITYAMGLNASKAVWVASKFSTEHLRVLKWLNNNHNGNTLFYAVEVSAEATPYGYVPIFRLRYPRTKATMGIDFLD